MILSRLYSSRGRALCFNAMAFVIGAAFWAVLLWSFLP
jgi:hypothetical protein